MNFIVRNFKYILIIRISNRTKRFQENSIYFLKINRYNSNFKNPNICYAKDHSFQIMNISAAITDRSSVFFQTFWSFVPLNPDLCPCDSKSIYETRNVLMDQTCHDIKIARKTRVIQHRESHRQHNLRKDRCIDKKHNRTMKEYFDFNFQQEQTLILHLRAFSSLYHIV